MLLLSLQLEDALTHPPRSFFLPAPVTELAGVAAEHGRARVFFRFTLTQSQAAARC